MEDKKVTPMMEYFMGIGCAMLITGPSKVYIQKIALKISTNSALAFQGFECGIHCFASSDETPDHRVGVLCSVWVKDDNPTEINVSINNFEKLTKKITKIFQIILLPSLDLRIFNFNFLKKDFPVCYGNYDSKKNIGQFGDKFSIVEEAYGRNFVRIPTMGGDIWIEELFSYFQGYMGLNLFLFFHNAEEALNNQSIIEEFSNNFNSVCLIHSLAGSGSIVQRNNEVDFRTSSVITNYPFCPSLKNLIPDDTFVPAGCACVTEIVVNGYNLTDLTQFLSNIMKKLLKDKMVIRISAGSYKELLGKETIDIQALHKQN